jgi:hypothetical protein
MSFNYWCTEEDDHLYWLREKRRVLLTTLRKRYDFEIATFCESDYPSDEKIALIDELDHQILELTKYEGI